LATRATKTLKKSKSKWNRELDPATESIALGSAFSVLFVLLLKSLVLAIPMGLLLAFAHHHGRSKSRKKH